MVHIDPRDPTRSVLREEDLWEARTQRAAVREGPRAVPPVTSLVHGVMSVAAIAADGGDLTPRMGNCGSPGGPMFAFPQPDRGKRGMPRASSIRYQKAMLEGTLGHTYIAAGNFASINSSNAHGISTSYQYDSLDRPTPVIA